MSTRTPCPKCGKPSQIRSSRSLSDNTIERYCVCGNSQCLCIFKTMTSVVKTIFAGISSNNQQNQDLKNT